MRERLGLILKLACYVLAALLLYQVVQTGRRLNPLARVKIPALPALDSETNSLTAGALGTNSPARTGTNSAGTNSRSNGVLSTVSAGTTTNSTATNAAVPKGPKEFGTNLDATIAAKPGATNTPTLPPSFEGEKSIVLEGSATVPTNSRVIAKIEVPGSNSIVIPPTTNMTAGVDYTPTNFPPTLAALGTNVSPPIAALGTNGTGTNASAKATKTNSPPSAAAMAAMNMNPAMMRGGGGGKSDLPPEIKARVDKIYESELFGMIMRPQPMALQGIAGNSAFLRTPSGQTGLVKEGDSLGEIKLLRIGINRVLVEQDGQKSELTIFNGYGGESLMPKDKETSK